jgi:hypothetical protein
MAFKLTYSDGQETNYDDGTEWEVENGVVKLGREPGNWTVFVSPSHWATLELATGNDDKDEDRGKHEERDEKDKDKKDKKDDEDKKDEDKKDDS